MGSYKISRKTVGVCDSNLTEPPLWNTASRTSEGEAHRATGMLVCLSFKGYFYADSKLVSGIVSRETHMLQTDVAG